MISDKSKLRFGITDLLLVAVSVVLLVGISTWFATCAAGETVMSCHWAGETVKALAILSVVLSLIHVFLPDSRLKAGIDIAGAGIAFVIMRVPGSIISLCGNAEMTCRRITQPWVLVCGIVMLIAFVADAIFYTAKLSNDRHKRCDK